MWKKARRINTTWDFFSPLSLRCRIFAEVEFVCCMRFVQKFRFSSNGRIFSAAKWKSQKFEVHLQKEPWACAARIASITVRVIGKSVCVCSQLKFEKVCLSIRLYGGRWKNGHASSKSGYWEKMKYQTSNSANL